jgi:hypothetical protein
VKARQGYVRNHISSEFNLSGTYKIDINVEGNEHVRLNTLSINDFPWKGLYYNDVPVKLEAIPTSGHKFARWEGIETTDREHLTLNTDSSTVLKALFVPYEEGSNQVIINEINYNSNIDFDPGDWVELLNVSDHSINVSGWIIKDDDGNEFILPEGIIIDSHGFLVVCRNNEKFSRLFSSVEIVDGEMDFGFSSGGECIQLFTTNKMLMDKVCYENDNPWPTEPNGSGATLALLHTLGNNEHPVNWNSSKKHGTPGAKNKDIITDLNERFDEMTANKEITIYPNPSKGYITIKMQSSRQEEVSFALSDVNGKFSQKVLKYSISQGDNDLNVDIQEFRKDISSGIYILHMESNSFRKQLRVMIQN